MILDQGPDLTVLSVKISNNLKWYIMITLLGIMKPAYLAKMVYIHVFWRYPVVIHIHNIFQYETKCITNTLTACSSPMSGWLKSSTKRFFHSPEPISCCVSRISTAMVNHGNSGAEGRTNKEFGAVVPAVSQDSKANTPPPPVCWYSGLWCTSESKEDEGGCAIST